MLLIKWKSQTLVSYLTACFMLLSSHGLLFWHFLWIEKILARISHSYADFINRFCILFSLRHCWHMVIISQLPFPIAQPSCLYIQLSCLVHFSMYSIFCSWYFCWLCVSKTKKMNIAKAVLSNLQDRVDGLLGIMVTDSDGTTHIKQNQAEVAFAAAYHMAAEQVKNLQKLILYVRLPNYNNWEEMIIWLQNLMILCLYSLAHK